MKISLKKLLAAIFGASLFFAGCSNVNDVKKDDDRCSVTVSVSNFQEQTRQINPTQFTKTDFSKITIQGKTSYGDTLDETELEFGDDGKATITLSFAPWELTLLAYKEDDVVLMGKTFKDLSNGGDEITFKLSTKNVDTAGSVDFTCNYTSGSAHAEIKKIKVGLYGKLDKSVILDKDGGTTEKLLEPDSDTFDYEVSKITPGTYSFMVTFYGDDATTKKIGLWSDTVLIAPGNTTTSTITIPDVIMKKPEAPTNLKAFYVTGSEKEANYKVKLVWEDNSTNEENFVITIKEYASNDDASPSDYKIFGVKDSAADKKEVFTSSDSNAGGSILANNTECVITLPTGKLFDVSIMAENFAGTSASCERVQATGLEDGLTTSDGYSPIDIAGNKKINKIKLTYIFDSATMTGDDGKKYYGPFNEYKEWPSETGTKEFALLDVKTLASKNKPTIVKDNHEWKCWLSKDGDSNTKVEKHLTSKDGTYYADFNLDYKVSYTIEDFKDFEDEEVSITYGSNQNVADASIKNSEEITVTVTGAYDYYQVDFNGSVRYFGENSTFKFKAGSGVTGIKTIVVLAKVKGSKDEWVGKTITATFEN